MADATTNVGERVRVDAVLEGERENRGRTLKAGRCDRHQALGTTALRTLTLATRPRRLRDHKCHPSARAYGLCSREGRRCAL